MADGDTGDFAPKTVPRADVRPDLGLLRSARSQVPGGLQGPDQAAEGRGQMPPLRRGEGAPHCISGPRTGAAALLAGLQMEGAGQLERRAGVQSPSPTDSVRVRY